MPNAARAAMAMALVSCLTVLAPLQPGRGETRVAGPLAPAEGVLFGAHAKTGSSEEAQRAGVESLEVKLGRTLAIDHFYKPWTHAFPTWREQWDLDNGRIPMISWGKTYAGDVALGLHDDLIRTRATGVAGFGQPLFLRWFWEMEGNRNLEYSQSPADYIAAWRRIHGIFVEEGATNAVFVWCPNASGFTTGDAQQYYPGDEYVDWTCADGYNWFTKPGDRDRSFEDLFRDFYDWASARPKPIMVGEYGVLESTPEHKADWVNAAREALKADFPAIAAVVYFNSSGNDNNGVFRDWRVDTSASSLQAFLVMGADPYFNGGPAVPPPDTVIHSGPSGMLASADAAVAFSSDQPGARFQCRMDDADFADCTSPATQSGLADGLHTFEVRARTGDGRTDPTPARRTWSVDTTGPAVTAVTPSDGGTGVAPTAVIEVGFSEALDPTTVTSSTFTIAGEAGVVPANASYDIAAHTATLSPGAPLQAGSSYTAILRGGTGGVTDAVGNPMAADRVWRFTTAPSSPRTVAFAPLADARVDKAHPKTNYGRSRKLRARGGSAMESYLRFVVADVAGTVQSAKLRLFVTDGTSDGPALYSTANGWIESGTGSITWRNRPPSTGAAIDDRGRVPTKGWMEYDVTSVVKGGGTFSFVLISRSKDALEVHSRERAGKRPELVVVTR